MKRLLCIISSMDAGGAETFLMKIYRTLDRTKYQMDFCVNRSKKTFYEDEIIALDGKVYKIPPKTKNYIEFKKQLTKIIKNNNYQYVLRCTSNSIGFIDVKIAKKAGAKICAVRSTNSKSSGGLLYLLAHKVGLLLYKKYVDIKIAPSDLAAIYTFGEKDYKSGNVFMLNNGLDLNIFHYSEEGRRKIRDEFDLSDNIKIIGHVGRFMKQKNHNFLIEVFNEIYKKDKNTKLMLVGNGELEHHIKEKIKAMNLSEAVVFTGLRSDIPDILSAMDIFVFPSLYEGMPNVVIEAQATGLPCIISDTITKEVNITGKIRFQSLQCSKEVWVDAILDTLRSEHKENRTATSMILKKQGYDIQDVTNKFTKLIFNENV